MNRPEGECNRSCHSSQKIVAGDLEVGISFGIINGLSVSLPEARKEK